MKFEHNLLGEFRAQYIEESGRIWASRGYDVYFSDNLGDRFLHRARLDIQPIKRALSRWALPSRFLRAGFLNLRPMKDGSLVGVVHGGIVRCNVGSERFEPVLQRRGRSMKIEECPDGSVFSGEYFYNKKRSQVDVFRSDDNGGTWHIAHRFEPGQIRHIHCMMHDKRTGSMIILTGDTDKESKVLATEDQFKSLKILAQGSQQTRAVSILPTDGGYFLATDTPYEQNYIQFLSFSGELRSLCPISGSCLSACQVGDWSLFGTAAEPSQVNRDSSVTVYATRNGHEWLVLARWLTDRWSWPTGFQAGSLPDG